MKENLNNESLIMNDEIETEVLAPKLLTQDPEPISNMVPEMDMNIGEVNQLNVSRRQAVEDNYFNVYLTWPAVADMFTFSWGLYSCEVYPNIPLCDEPPDFYSEVVWKTNDTQKEVRVAGI